MNKLEMFIKWKNGLFTELDNITMVRDYILKHTTLKKNRIDIIDRYTLRIDINKIMYLVTFDEYFITADITKGTEHLIGVVDVKDDLLFLDEIADFFSDKLALKDLPTKTLNKEESNDFKIPSEDINGYNSLDIVNILRFYKYDLNNCMLEDVIEIWESCPVYTMLGDISNLGENTVTHLEVKDNLIYIDIDYTLSEPNTKEPTVISFTLKLIFNMVENKIYFNNYYLGYNNVDDKKTSINIRKFEVYQNLISSIKEYLNNEGIVNCISELEKLMIKFNEDIYNVNCNALKFLLYTLVTYKDSYDDYMYVYVNQEEDSLYFYFYETNSVKLYFKHVEKHNLITISLNGKFNFYTYCKFPKFEEFISNVHSLFALNISHDWLNYIQFIYDNSSYLSLFDKVNLGGNSYYPIELILEQITFVYLDKVQFGLIENKNMVDIYVNSNVRYFYSLNKNKKELYRVTKEIINLLDR